jgi:DNA-binding NarL/FixJ family response regulator
LIVDDHPLMREGLALRISSQAGWQVCGESDSADDALAQVKATSPDLVIVDLALNKSHGLELIKELKRRFPLVKVLVVSAYEESLYAERALRAGALGYVNKRECQDKILQAIRDVLAGRRAVSETMTQHLLRQAVGDRDTGEGDAVERLSDRELEVFRLIGKGLKTSAIANQLHLSIHTVDSHREKIRHKLNLKNGAELVQRAVQWILQHG